MFISTCIKILKNSTDIKFFQIVKKKKFKDSSIIERTKMKKKKIYNKYMGTYMPVCTILLCVYKIFCSR